MSTTYIYFIDDSKIELWGLSGKERLIRSVAKDQNVVVVEDLSQIPADSRVFILRADYLFETRLLKSLFTVTSDLAVMESNNETIVAISTSIGKAPALIDSLVEDNNLSAFAAFEQKQPEALVNAYDPKLLKYDPPFIHKISEDNKNNLEAELFDGSYKGITDFVTKWLWPIPAKVTVRLCAERGISPNQVTVLSLFLAIFAGLAFWSGLFITGLLLGWLMTFLDTVDGKLARVTVTSSKAGDVLDHGLDLIHPPFWYLAWGAGVSLQSTLLIPLDFLFWLILAAYIGGRICEGLFQAWIAKFSMFLWEPLDAFNRLVTARRNPNLFILTLSLLMSRPDIGLYLVVIWHITSTIILAVRVYQGYKEKRKQGSIYPWLSKIDPVKDSGRLDVRLFTRIKKT